MTLSNKTLIFGVIALTALIVAVPSVFAHHAWTNPSGDPYHWARTTPSFSLQLIDNMSKEWDAALEGAVNDWNQSAVVDFTQKRAKRNTPCIRQAGKVIACNETYGQNGWLGLTTINVTGGEHITDAVVQLNDTYYNTPQFNNSVWRNMAVCHEVGHTIGLGHNDEDFTTINGTCMDYANDPTLNQHPDQHDYAELASIYSHLDTFDSYAGGTSDGSKGGGKGRGNKPSAGYEVDVNDRTTWGQIVSRDAQNNPSVFAKKKANGDMLVTHVTWVDGFDFNEE